MNYKITISDGQHTLERNYGENFFVDYEKVGKEVSEMIELINASYPKEWDIEEGWKMQPGHVEET